MDGIFAFFDNISHASFDFSSIIEFFGGIITGMQSSPGVADVWNTIFSFAISLGMLTPLILLALSVLELLFGKKLMAVQRFVALFVVGYCAGVYFVSPAINNVFALPDYISGIVIAIVVAVLSKYLYFVILAIASAYSVYYICYSAAFLPFLQGVTSGNGPICFVIALLVTILVFVLLKYIEMIGTSILGAFLVSKCITMGFFNYSAFLGENWWILELAVIGVIAIAGSIFQIKTRTRY